MFEGDLRYDCLLLKTNPNAKIFMIASNMNIIVVTKLIHLNICWSQFSGSLNGVQNIKDNVDNNIEIIIMASNALLLINLKHALLSLLCLVTQKIVDLPYSLILSFNKVFNVIYLIASLFVVFLNSYSKYIIGYLFFILSIIELHKGL